jgi:hypothetical protein
MELRLQRSRVIVVLLVARVFHIIRLASGRLRHNSFNIYQLYLESFGSEKDENIS